MDLIPRTMWKRQWNKLYITAVINSPKERNQERAVVQKLHNSHEHECYTPMLTLMDANFKSKWVCMSFAVRQKHVMIWLHPTEVALLLSEQIIIVCFATNCGVLLSIELEKLVLFNYSNKSSKSFPFLCGSCVSSKTTVSTTDYNNLDSQQESSQKIDSLYCLHCGELSKGTP